MVQAVSFEVLKVQTAASRLGGVLDHGFISRQNESLYLPPQFYVVGTVIFLYGERLFVLPPAVQYSGTRRII